MKYQIDHDLHIHSNLSLCSNDPTQTPERILEYAKLNKLKKICVTNHFWDSAVDGASNWYKIQDLNRISSELPLPQAEGIEFLFGCETDLSKELILGISKETVEKLDFIIIPTTHLHMNGFTIEEDVTVAKRAELYVNRLDWLLSQDLPFHKIGIAHLACSLMLPGGQVQEILGLISDQTFTELFQKAAKVGVGIELNAGDFELDSYSEEKASQILRVFSIAKKCGCKFYLGSDAHHPSAFEGAIPAFNAAIDALCLEESDKFTIQKQ